MRTPLMEDFLLQYFLSYEFLSSDRQTDGRTDGQKALHMSPPSNMHRWAQKVG